MIQLTKIYTRGGDKGKTSLGSGQRLAKCALRIEAIGAVDELNAFIGLLINYSDNIYHNSLIAIQHDLFDLGADLCVLAEKTVISEKSVLRITEKQVLRIEKDIDDHNLHLNPLNSFVLPGGSRASSYCHIARTIARRAERTCVALMLEEKLNPYIIHYLNRLSDYLFVIARILNQNGKEDVLWKPGKNQ